MLMPVSSIFQILAGLLSKSAFSMTPSSAEKYFAILNRVMAWCLPDDVASGVLSEKDGFRVFSRLHHICDGLLFLKPLLLFSASNEAYFKTVLLVSPAPCSARCSAVSTRIASSSLLKIGCLPQIAPCSTFPVMRSESDDLGTPCILAAFLMEDPDFTSAMALDIASCV